MTEFRKGDRVSWKSHGGTAEGEVVKKITEDTEAGGRTVRASRDEPQYLVRSDKSGGEAVHKPAALTRDELSPAQERISRTTARSTAARVASSVRSGIALLPPSLRSAGSTVRPVLEPLQHPRVDVGRAGHRRGVAEVLGHLLDRVVHHPLAGALRRRHAALGHAGRQRDRGQHGGVPGTQVLAGVLLPGQLLHRRVEVLGAHVVPLAADPVGQQILARRRGGAAAS